MKAVVLSGGQIVSKKTAVSYLDEAEILICADKGAEYAVKYGVVPDFIVGDMDSIDVTVLKEFNKSRIITSSKEKDFTDTQLAVMKAIESGADDVTILCATGLRSDHALANIRLLLQIEQNGATGRIADDENVIWLCTGTAVFENKSGTTVSLLSLSEKTSGITLEGFKYPLFNRSAGLDWTTGISNEIINDRARITLGEGCLLVFEIRSD